MNHHFHVTNGRQFPEKALVIDKSNCFKFLLFSDNQFPLSKEISREPVRYFLSIV